MMLKSQLVLVIVVTIPALLLSEDKQVKSEALLQRARAASDIRAPNQSPFRLKVEFSFVSDSLETVHGTYTEWWVSSNQWRRETEAEDSKRLEIGGAERHWLLDTGNALPEQVRKLPALVNILSPKSVKVDFDSLLDPAPSDIDAVCAITIPGPGQQRSAYCFHKPSGVLIQKVEPFLVGPRIKGYSCDYAGFRMFGKLTYPREMACFIEGHKRIEARVTELTEEAPFSASLFTAPPGAIELDSCFGKLQLPRAISDPIPPLPLGVSADGSVVVELVVDTKGFPKNVRVLRSGAKPLNDQAVRAVRTWRFKPATCDGRAIGMMNTVQVTFRARR